MKKLIDTIKEYKRVCWYPSAGSDFLPMYCLSDLFLSRYPQHNCIKEIPDLFLYTDCTADVFDPFLEVDDVTDRAISAISSETDKIGKGDPWSIRELFNNGNITVTPDHVEELSMPEDYSETPYSFCSFDQPKAYKRAFLFDVSVRYQDETTWKIHLIYVLAQNEYFASNILIRNVIDVSHVIVVRYGESFGGAAVNPSWIKYILPVLNTKYYIANSSYTDENEAENVDEGWGGKGKHYTDIPYYNEEIVKLLTSVGVDLNLVDRPWFNYMMSISKNMWSNYGQVNFYRLD